MGASTRTLPVKAGQRYGRLTVTDPQTRMTRASGTSIPAATCTCDCGNPKTVPLYRLVQGITKSCGCLRREGTGGGKANTHGMRKHPLYPTWNSIMYRCYGEHHHEREHYGGRGIAVDPQWHDVTAFIAWIEGNLGPKPTPQHTLDRINNDRNYEPGNLRWATREEQIRNRRPSRARAKKIATKSRPPPSGHVASESGRHGHLAQYAGL
jgi:hypothetical protein